MPPHEFAEGSSTINSPKYDVFLSFRGKDTRLTFTSHFHLALKKANIETFYDDEEIEFGRPLKEELVNGIKASRASVIVLSENYASSTWCLDELALIYDQFTTSNHMLFPIFLNIEPSDMKKQESTFGKAMTAHVDRMEAETNVDAKRELADKIEIWKNVLAEVSKLKGEATAGRQEAVVIEKVIADVHHMLHVTLKKNQPDLTGMEDHIDYISSWLNDGSTHTADILTILGMAGIGKTSLAQYIYNLHCLLFQRSSFIVDINRKCSQQSEKMLDLQTQLFSNISKSSSIQVDHIAEYTSKIENALQGKKVLLVLDDVESLDQLYALLGNKGFHPGSKIIITTEDASLTMNFVLRKQIAQPKHTVHILEGLNEASSLQILCTHAFKCNGVVQRYEEVCEKLVKYSEGHPGALKEMGRYLHKRDIEQWEEYIESLSQEMDYHIEKVLRKSFDSLRSQNDKELFKHIASFFAGKDRGFAETILKACGIRLLNGIKNLTDKFLIKIGPRNELMMHQLLQDMGRAVIRQESCDKPWKRSRLWCPEESLDVLQQNMDKRHLKGIILDSRMLKSHESVELETDALRNMDNLMLLQLNHVQFNGSYHKFPKKLRWLCMHGFHLTYLPSDLPMENVVVLDMSYSNIKCFDMSNYSNIQNPQERKKLTAPSSKGKSLLRSLKILNLSFCYQLCSIYGFHKLPALERLILANCRSLTEICGSIGHCGGIVFIDLSYCSMLKKLPSTLFMLKKLEALSLDGCNLGEFPFSMRDKRIVKLLNANMIRKYTQVSSSVTLEALPRYIRSFANSLASSCLVQNKCCNEPFPMAFTSLSVMDKLDLDGKPILHLPNCVRSLRRIELLSLEECDMLKTIKDTTCALRSLKFSRWELLKEIEYYPGMSSLVVALTIYLFAHSSIEIEGIVKMQPIAQVEEVVLCRLGWNDLSFIKNQKVGTWQDLRRKEKTQVQLFYEFGIFSTCYGGKEIPNWIKRRFTGPTEEFIVPSSPNTLRGLIFCHLQTGRDLDGGVNLLTVIVRNKTKDHTWIYKPYTHWVKVDEECLIWLSHWMFGKNEMADGDEVAISILEEDVSSNVSIRECGISFVYDDVKIEEEDPLSYYKSWHHIIGGDLSAFRLTTEEYLLDNHRFFLWHVDCPVNRPFIANGACYEEKGVYFRAFR